MPILTPVKEPGPNPQAIKEISFKESFGNWFGRKGH